MITNRKYCANIGDNGCVEENFIPQVETNIQNEESFNIKIKNWAVNYYVSVQCFDDLLKMLSTENINV